MIHVFQPLFHVVHLMGCKCLAQFSVEIQPFVVAQISVDLTWQKHGNKNERSEKRIEKTKRKQVGDWRSLFSHNFLQKHEWTRLTRFFHGIFNAVPTQIVMTTMAVSFLVQKASVLMKFFKI